MAKKLRPYQEELKAKIYAEWDKGHKNVMAVMNTGLGKTQTFCTIADEIAVKAEIKKPTAIIVHRKELVQQISLTLAEKQIVHNIIAPRKTIQGIVAAQRSEYGKQFYHYSSLVSVISVDTLNARIDKHRKWAETIKFWIVDEATHLLKDNKWGKATSYFTDAIGLGVTATPERLDGKGLSAETDGVFHTMVEGPNTKWAMHQGFLCKYKVALPKSHYEDYLKNASSGSDFSKKAMTEASQKSQIVGDVVVNYKKFAMNKQTIVFATDINTAEDMTTEFNEAGIKAVLLTGNSTDKERLDGMVSFRNKETKVLVNVDLFDEGLDVPGIECVQMARPTMSLAKYRQMVGRGLRPASNKPHLILIDHVGNVMRHGLPCENTKWTLDRRVKRKKKVSLLRICENPLCLAPYDRFLSECPYCGEAPTPREGGGRVPPEKVDGDLELMDPDTIREMEEDTWLESPADICARVSKAAGRAAGQRAQKNQIERINVQRELAENVAKWAGFRRHEGYDDRAIHKIFFINFGKTINQALSEPKADMLKTMEGLNE